MLTGGACERVKAQAAAEANTGMETAGTFFSSVACKAGGGTWKGGHDISGHVFLLVLGSMFLFEEIAHVVRGRKDRDERTVRMEDGKIKSVGGEVREGEEEMNGEWGLSVKVVLGVAGLSWWMLLMTAAYFHTWVEKVSLLLSRSSKYNNGLTLHSSLASLSLSPESSPCISSLGVYLPSEPLSVCLGYRREDRRYGL